MAITGDISEFSISDMIGFLNDTHRSGTFRTVCIKGECNLVFSNGEIVSANFIDGLVRIGQVLVSIGAITKSELSWALTIQEQDSNIRKPLVLTLLEHNIVEKNAAYNGMKLLIVMTLVEILSWNNGCFIFEEFDVKNPVGWHDYLSLYQEISVNAKEVLLESLLIIDEKRRDGTMNDVLSIVGLSSTHPLLIEAN
jgi:hypothetical protein